MKHAFGPELSAFLAAGVFALAACSPDATTGVQSASSNVLTPTSAGYNAAGVHRQYGTPVKLGDGNARVYVVVDAKNNQAPLELGIALSEKSLEGLPTEGMGMYLLPLPKFAPEPYKLVELDWNSHGHEPEGVYTFPHFDFHFYTITRAQRDAIVPTDPNYTTEANNLPTDGYVPPAYAPLGAPGDNNMAHFAVPMMGLHWEDLLSPELQGLLGHPENYRKFDKTFIYGSWNGQFIFYEPMITLEYLQTKPDVTSPVRTPQLYPQAGYFPTSYRVTYDAQAKEYHVALTGLVQHN